MRLNFDSWFKRRILHVPNWIEIKLNNLCLLEWEYSRHSRSAILFGKTTKISIWFGACKMRRLNLALELCAVERKKQVNILGDKLLKSLPTIN